MNPAVLEDLASSQDDNCNDRRAMFISHAEPGFSPAPWTDTGLVVRTTDTISVSMGASSTRQIVRPVNTGVVVALGVNSGSGSGCEIRLGTSEPGASGFTWRAQPIAGFGVQYLDFTGSFAPPEVIKRIQVRCDAASTIALDWLQIQDALVEFAPPEDLNVEWRDTRLPAGGHMISVVRDDTNGTVYVADDVSGVGRFDGTSWTVVNGEGSTSLVMGGILGVTDLLPLEDGSEELFALMGDMNGGYAGGLWHSYDKGDTWEQLASSEFQWGGQPWVDATYDDDVMGDPRSSNCAAGSSDELIQAGGRLLEAHSASPLAGDVIYVANADPHNMGVSIWDGTDLCDMPNSGDPLPEDLVGALLRVDALPNSTPVLMVGYRALLDGEPSLYACTLPPGGPTCGGASAVCEAVPLGDGAPDVRDMEHDTWMSDILLDTAHTGVLVADAGGRPTTTSPTCDYYGGSVGRVVLEDSAGWGTLTIAIEDDWVTSLDLPDVASGFALTGISLDPDSEYLFVNTPSSPNQRYSFDRAYRAEADVLFGTGTAPFDALNSNEPVTVPMNEEDVYESVRHNHDMDMAGAWLEAVVNGRANVFPARSAPGAMPDFEWITSFAYAWGDLDLAAGFNGHQGWWMAWLDMPWTDNEAEEDVDYPADTIAQSEGDVLWQFLPGIDVLGYKTPQGTAAREAAIGHDGHIWMAQGDLGLSHVDASVVATTANPAGAEVDCLWAGWSAGANSVVTVTHSGEDGPDMTPVVWATLMDQSATGPNHDMGVLRSLDNGATWEYAAAGFMSGTITPEHSVVFDAWDPAAGVYGFRACRDESSTHVAAPFLDPTDPLDDYSPAHAFSAGTTLAAGRDVATDTIGYPARVRALDENLALVWLRPDDDGAGSYTGTGGLYLTADGGSTWAPLDYDGGAGSCDQTSVFAAGTFELRATPSDEAIAPWDGADGALEVLVSVVNGGAPSEQCALARVVVEDLGTAPTATWTWTSLPKLNNTAWTASTCGGVHYDNLIVAAPASWSSEVMIGGSYIRNFNGAGIVSNVWGGACLVNLDTGAMRLVLDPRVRAVGVSALAPHPAVADTWVVLPNLDVGNFQECNTNWNGGSVSLACEDPLPLLIRGTTAGTSSTTLSSRYPHMVPASVVWSEIGVPDDSADAEGSWLVVATSGGGTWRGDLTW